MSGFWKKACAALCFVVLICNVALGSSGKLRADVRDVEEFVERNYTYILNRHADPAGLTNWTNALKSGQMDAATVVSGFLNSNEYKSQNHSDQETVEILYKVMLSRTPDAEGFKVWTDALYYGMSYNYVIDGFSGSLEFKNLCSSYGINPGYVKLTENRDKNYLTTKFVGNLYHASLGRAPDKGGLNDWTNRLNTKAAYPEDVIRTFLKSPECTPLTLSDEVFINVCYQGILQRYPDASEVQSWSEAIKANGRDFMLDCFFKSAEFATVVAAHGLSLKPATPPKPTLNRNTKMVCLTFDDGPYSPVTNRILDVLEKYGGHATFFVVGNRVPQYKSCVTRAESLGCEIGNHTYDHKSVLTSMSAGSISSEISGCNSEINKVLGHSARIMRPVGGAYNNTVKNNVGMPMINWSVDTQDWKNRNTQTIVNNILNNVKDGDIILMHDLYPATAAAMEIVIPELVRRGYTLVTVSEMAEARGVNLQNGNVYTAFRP